MPTSTVDMQVGLEVILSYRRLDYSPWYALAEFIDNSTQSYRNNKKKLKAAYSREGRGLQVNISYHRDANDRDASVLIVRDNAMGMALPELRRALRIGKPPDDVTWRSQFGLGLKTAACWFGNKWSIRTKKLGASHGYVITVDVEKVAAGASKLRYKRFRAAHDEHFTEIRIERLHVVLQGRRLGKTKDSLSSMYRVDIRTGDLALTWDTSPLPWADTLSFLPNEDGTAARETIDFRVGGRRVWGWIDILAPGSSGRPNAGFALIRRGRLIRGWPDAWRPESIFGAAPGRNDLVNQRVVGELHFDQFDVTHTKDDINWQGTEEDDVQAEIKKRIPALLTRARKFRIQEAPVVPAVPEARALAVAALLKDSDLGARIVALGPALDTLIAQLPPAELADTWTGTLGPFAPVGEKVLTRLGSGALIQVVVSLLVDEAPYMVVTEDGPGSWQVVLNAGHLLCYASDDAESLRCHVQHAVAEALVAVAIRAGSVTASDLGMLLLKNALLVRLSQGRVS